MTICLICNKEIIGYKGNYHPRCAGNHQGGTVKAMKDKKQVKFI